LLALALLSTCMMDSDRSSRGLASAIETRLREERAWRDSRAMTAERAALVRWGGGSLSTATASAAAAAATATSAPPPQQQQQQQQQQQLLQVPSQPRPGRTPGALMATSSATSAATLASINASPDSVPEVWLKLGSSRVSSLVCGGKHALALSGTQGARWYLMIG